MFGGRGIGWSECFHLLSLFLQGRRGTREAGESEILFTSPIRTFLHATAHGFFVRLLVLTGLCSQQGFFVRLFVLTRLCSQQGFFVRLLGLTCLCSQMGLVLRLLRWTISACYKNHIIWDYDIFSRKNIF